MIPPLLLGPGRVPGGSSRAARGAGQGSAHRAEREGGCNNKFLGEKSENLFKHKLEDADD